MRALDALLRPAGWLAAGALLLAPAVASGAESAADAEAGATLERSVRFLQEAQNPDGGFGAGSDPIVSAWAAYALAAAGINPRDQARPGGIDVHAYLTEHTGDLYQTTDFARVALVALASGTSPRRFGGTDPLGAILSRQLPDGSFPQEPGKADGWVNATIWSIFPLSAVGGDAAEGAIARAATWLLDHQHASGGWTATRLGGAPDTDTTGAAIQALNAAGLRGTEAEERALEYLRGAQRPDGGFEALAGFGSNSATTAWVIQGMWAAGVDPRSWRTASGDPLSYLASLQRPDGSIGYTATSDTNSLWMTAQVGPALAGRAYPLAAVRRQAEPSLPPPEATAEAASPPREETRHGARRGHGGFEARRGEGVIAGGGGNGAPLFSAPQPQSGGATPGAGRGGAETAAGAGGGERAARTGHAKRGKGDGGASGERVEGTVVAGMRAVVAPGLLGAADGGDPGPMPTAALLGALILAGALGALRERSDRRR